MIRRTTAVAVLNLAAALAPMPVLADRISDMPHTERCAYTTKLEVLAAWYRTQGTPRQAMKIHWHGDETAFEIEFVNRTLDAGYALMDNEFAAGRGDTPLELLGDRVYEACINGRES